MTKGSGAVLRQISYLVSVGSPAVDKAAHNVPGPLNGRLLRGHSGSVEFRGMHMGKPEKDVMLGLWSSAVMKEAPLKPLEKTAFGSEIRTVGPF